MNKLVNHAEESVIKVLDTWATGTTENALTISAQDHYIHQPHIRQTTDFNLWFSDEDKFDLEISRRHMIDLAGVFADKRHRISETLMNTEFTREELETLRNTIGALLSAIDGGGVISREESYRLRREPEDLEVGN